MFKTLGKVNNTNEKRITFRGVSPVELEGFIVGHDYFHDRTFYLCSIMQYLNELCCIVFLQNIFIKCSLLNCNESYNYQQTFLN